MEKKHRGRRLAILLILLALIITPIVTVYLQIIGFTAWNNYTSEGKENEVVIYYRDTWFDNNLDISIESYKRKDKKNSLIKLMTKLDPGGKSPNDQSITAVWQSKDLLLISIRGEGQQPEIIQVDFSEAEIQYETLVGQNPSQKIIKKK